MAELPTRGQIRILDSPLKDSPSVLCLLWRFLVSACWWVHLWTQGSSPCSNCLENSLFPRGRTFPNIYSHREQSLCPWCSKHSKTPSSVLLFFFFFFLSDLKFLFISFFIFNYLTARGLSCSMWASSLATDWTQILCTGSVESWSLDHQGSPCTAARKAHSEPLQNKLVSWLHSPALLCSLSLFSSLRCE